MAEILFISLGFLAQNRIAGEGKGIRDELITLEIGSPNGPDLTLIDLPGITRVALPDQPPDIEQQVCLMAFKGKSRHVTYRPPPSSPIFYYFFFKPAEHTVSFFLQFSCWSNEVTRNSTSSLGVGGFFLD